MKRCPFCAEEIQDAAIKCRFCGSFLSAAPPASTPAAPAPQPAAAPAPAAPAPAAPAPAAPAPAAPAAPAPAPSGPPFAHHAGPDTSHERKTLYDGVPSWRAYFGHYFFGTLAALLVPGLFYKILGVLDVPRGTRLLFGLAVLGGAAIYFAGLHFYRRSIRVRVTTTNIETERGILSKKIDVLELWRCRDVRYKQSFLDRILGVAHIEIYTADVTTPQLEMVGLPASRQLFERIRDSIELQRQARNVYGVVS